MISDRQITGLGLRAQTVLTLQADPEALTQATAMISLPAPAPGLAAGLLRADLIAEQAGHRVRLASTFVPGGTAAAWVLASGWVADSYHLDLLGSSSRLVAGASLAVRDCCGGVLTDASLLDPPPGSDPAFDAVGPLPFGGRRGQIRTISTVGDGTVALPAGSRVLDVYVEKTAAQASTFTITRPDGSTEVVTLGGSAGAGTFRFRFDGQIAAASVTFANVTSGTVVAVR